MYPPPLGEPTCSDHDLITFDIKSDSPVTRSCQSNNPSLFWLFQKASIPNIMIDCYDLHTHVRDYITASKPIDDVWNLFKSSLLQTAQKNIPAIFRKPRSNPWITRQTKREIARRRRWKKASKQHTSQLNDDRVREQSKLCDRLVNRDYNAYINRYICDKLETGNSQPLFKFIGNRRGNANTIKKLDGCSDDSDPSIADRLAEAFCSVFTRDDGRTPSFPLGAGCQPNSITINAQGVLKQLQSLDKSKGAGPDGLSPGLLRFLASYIYQPLSLIFQYSLDTGQVPREWRHANVIPVYKNGSRTDPLNYRPISMTCIVSKILEHVICHDVNSFLDSHNVLVDCQHGFRKGYGCETQLLTTITELTQSYDSKVPVDLAVLDFSKAFDTVLHSKLLLKLRSVGIHSTTCNWIANWLHERTMSVSVNACISPVKPVTSGVPQGSVLGPCYF